MKGKYMSECKATQCCDEQETCCPVEKSINEGCCPLEKSIELWSGSFFQAMKQVQVDLLKEKIRKNWGSVMEKQADAVVAAMGTQWQTLVMQAQAQCELRETMKTILGSAKK
jgi:hypothetical protein